MSGVPKQVKDAAQRAEELQKALAEPPPAETSAAETAQTAGAPDATPPDEAATAPDPATVAPDQTTETPPPKPETPPQEDKQAEARYRALKGKYDAEVPRLSDELRQLREQNTELLRMLTNARAQAPAHPATAPTPPDKPDYAARIQKWVDPKRREEYGDDLLATQAELAAGIVNEEVARMQQENETLRQRLDTLDAQVKTTTQSTFREHLTETCPEWEQLNTDPGFTQWLQQADPFSGTQRHQLLLGAYNAGDVGRTARFFKAYVAETTNTPAAPATPAAPSTVVSPRKAGGSAPPPKQTKTWTASEYRAAFQKMATGRMAPEDAKNLKAELDRAHAEGRIVPG